MSREGRLATLPPGLSGLGRTPVVGRLPSADGRTRPLDVLSLVWMVLRTSPEVARLVPDYARSYFGPRRIDPHLRERIHLRIARLNACGICTAVHTALAISEGMPTCDVKALEPEDFEVTAYPDDVQAALRLATQLASDGYVSDPSLLEDLRSHFPDWAVRQIFACARLMCWQNRVNRTLEGLLAWIA